MLNLFWFVSGVLVFSFCNHYFSLLFFFLHLLFSFFVVVFVCRLKFVWSYVLVWVCLFCCVFCMFFCCCLCFVLSFVLFHFLSCLFCGVLVLSFLYVFHLFFWFFKCTFCFVSLFLLDFCWWGETVGLFLCGVSFCSLLCFDSFVCLFVCFGFCLGLLCFYLICLINLFYTYISVLRTRRSGPLCCQRHRNP